MMHNMVRSPRVSPSMSTATLLLVLLAPRAAGGGAQPQQAAARSCAELFPAPVGFAEILRGAASPGIRVKRPVALSAGRPRRQKSF
jgi:hypothetical protein